MRPCVRITARIVSRMPPIVPRQEIEQRIALFQTALRDAELDAALIVESSDLYYLTGTNQDAHLVVPAEGEPVYLVRRDLGRARDESPLAHVEPLRSLRELGPAVQAAAGEIRRLGLEFDVLPVANYQRYAKALPGVELVDCFALLRLLRAVKSDWEVGRIRAAAQQIRIAWEAVPGLLRPG